MRVKLNFWPKMLKELVTTSALNYQSQAGRSGGRLAHAWLTPAVRVGQNWCFLIGNTSLPGVPANLTGKVWPAAWRR